MLLSRCTCIIIIVHAHLCIPGQIYAPSCEAPARIVAKHTEGMSDIPCDPAPYFLLFQPRTCSVLPAAGVQKTPQDI